jgi:hypothetical protein
MGSWAWRLKMAELSPGVFFLLFLCLGAIVGIFAILNQWHNNNLMYKAIESGKDPLLVKNAFRATSNLEDVLLLWLGRAKMDKPHPRSGLAQQLEASMIPTWYKEQELVEWLNNEGYPNRDDMPSFLAYHLQKAFEKGFKKASQQVNQGETK